MAGRQTRRSGGELDPHSHEDTWGASEEFKREWEEQNAAKQRAAVEADNADRAEKAVDQ